MFFFSEGEVDFLPFGADALGVHPRKGEQLADERGHVARAAADFLKRGGSVIVGRRFGEREFALGEDAGHRGAQLVGRVGGEPSLALERAVEAGEHLVEGGGHGVKLVPRAGEADALFQVVAVGDALGGQYNPGNRAECAARDEIAAQTAQQHHRREDHQYKKVLTAAHAALHACGDEAAEPEVGTVGKFQHFVVHPPAPRKAFGGVHLTGQEFLFKPDVPVEKVAVGVEHRHAHAGQLVEVAVDFQPSVFIENFVPGQPRGGYEGFAVIFFQRALFAGEHPRNRRRGNHRRQQRAQQRDPQLDAEPFHASSRRT